MEHTREFYIEEFRKAAERHEYFLYHIKQISGIGEKRYAEIESVLRKHLLPNEQ